MNKKREIEITIKISPDIIEHDEYHTLQDWKKENII